jgi:hypothetical protein
VPVAGGKINISVIGQRNNQGQSDGYPSKMVCAMHLSCKSFFAMARMANVAI